MIETKLKSKSNFVGYLGIKNYSRFEEDFILPTVRRFFAAQEIKSYKAINEQEGFADLDFNRSNFDDFFAHFYGFIVNEIKRNGDNVEIVVTYCITLDEENCSKTCDKTHIRYDEIFLYEQPVFYFIYVDIKDIFSCLRTMPVIGSTVID
jgi:hypothetical protein